MRKERIEKEIEERRNEILERKTFTQTRKSQTQGTRRTVDPYMKPIKGVYHTWDSSSWEYMNNSMYEYNSDKQITVEVYFDSTSGDSMNKVVYLYNSEGLLTSSIDYYHDGLKWIPNNKDSVEYLPGKPYFTLGNYYYMYDEMNSSWNLIFGSKSVLSVQAGKITQRIDQDYNGFTWDNINRINYVYDANGNVTEITHSFYSGTTPIPSFKEIYNYTSNIPVSVTFQYWYINWINAFRMNNATFDNPSIDFTDYIIFERDLMTDGKLSYYVEENWDMSANVWEVSGNYTATFTASGYEAIYGTWDGSSFIPDYIESFVISQDKDELTTQYDDNGSWENDYRRTTFYINNREETSGYKFETWDINQSEWEIDYWSQYFKDYDVNGKIISTTYKNWNSTTEVFENYIKEVYTDWKDFNPASIASHKSLMNVEFFPNPTNDKLNIHIQNSNGSLNNIRILDITGKVVYSTSAEGNNLVIPMGDLNTGMYFVEIASGQNYSVARIVKQ